jgi:hypothetical protein
VALLVKDLPVSANGCWVKHYTGNDERKHHASVIAGVLPLAPRDPGQCIQHLQHRNIRVVIFPCPVGRITPKVSRALSAACTHCTDPLKVLESSWYSRSDLVPVEIKLSHSTGQQISCFSLASKALIDAPLM